MKIETIRVLTDNNGGYKVINKDDFDPKTDKEFKPDAKKAAPKKPVKAK